MALVQLGMGVGRVVLLCGAGFVGSMAVRSGSFADILAEFQLAMEDQEASGSSGITEITKQLDQLATQLREHVSRAAVVYVDSAGNGVASSLVGPAAAAGALSYGYMRWKGISIASLMYVTKKNMANAVESMTTNLKQVQTSLAAAKRHLTQRIQHVDDKLEHQKEISGQIRDEVTGARLKLQNIGSDMQNLKEMAEGLGGKLDSIEAKQNYSLAGVMYLVEFIEQNGGRLPRSVENVQRTARLAGITGDKKQLLGLGQLLAIEPGSRAGGLHSTSPLLQFNAPSSARHSSTDRSKVL
ncbi:uncharacterized protein LOC102717113 [Oryza brachyantha]|uniref:DUF1664 domain-containing protein n=1 Tax=Oryza brachyantha TaxID=4533 RepID=J3KX39_ORYBR|nr:uncharacterized protein LOC102717113 [Oryza brachyantha]XP_015695972.1 uncharacterized protein LOC102717113 [Oryza brachyantha]